MKKMMTNFMIMLILMKMKLMMLMLKKMMVMVSGHVSSKDCASVIFYLADKCTKVIMIFSK